MYLFFDTETTGLSRRSDHVVQIAWALVDKNGVVSSDASYVIKPDGYSIPRAASDIHGITTAQACQIGEPLVRVLKEFSSIAKEAEAVVAHNIDFDIGILRTDYHRAGIAFPLDGKMQICTMRLSTEWCRLPKFNGMSGFKYPKLDELHYRLFGETFDGAHDAKNDVDACIRCYFALVGKGVITPPRMATKNIQKTKPVQPPTKPQESVSFTLPRPNELHQSKPEQSTKKPDSLPPATESQLAYKATHHDAAVRISVASDVACPEEIQLLLADDDDENVVNALARNTACTPVTFAYLYGEYGEVIAYEILENEAAPSELLAEFYWYDWGGETHPNFSRGAFDVFLADKANRSLSMLSGSTHP